MYFTATSTITFIYTYKQNFCILLTYIKRTSLERFRKKTFLFVFVYVHACFFLRKQISVICCFIETLNCRCVSVWILLSCYTGFTSCFFTYLRIHHLKSRLSKILKHFWDKIWHPPLYYMSGWDWCMRAVKIRES